MNKNIVISGLSFLVATSALAFGGSHGHKTYYYNGADAIGIHMNEQSCPEGSSFSGEGGYAVTLTGDNPCYCNELNVLYDAQTKKCNKAKPATCTTYKDCNKGEYCQFSPENNNTSGSGTCQNRLICNNQGLWKPTSKNLVYSMASASGSCSFDWWTAQDFCKSQGEYDMRMATLADLNCSSDFTCSDDPYAGSLREDLGNALAQNDVWVSDLAVDPTYSYGVDLGVGTVGDGYPHGVSVGMSVLCVNY